MEAPAAVDLGSRLAPIAIRHARLDLSWQVLRVLEDWTTERYYEVVGTPEAGYVGWITPRTDR
jgi:hypothetical protein